MLKQAALTGALAVVLAVPAVAQTTTPTTPMARPAPSAPSTTMNSTAIDGNKLIGQSIQNQADNKTVGKIDSVILDQSGKVQKVVVGVGGFLGMGKKDVAIDWSQVRVMDNGKKVVMNADKDQLKAMPEYVWPKDHKRGSVWTASDTDRRAPATTSSGSAGSTTTGTGMSSPSAPADTATPRTQR
jgi:hypothetical protein